MSDRPRYARIAAELRQAIEDGTYPPGALIPSQPELARAYDVTIQTAARATHELARQGLITTHHRRGSIVTPRRIRRSEPIQRYDPTPDDTPPQAPPLRITDVTVTEHPAAELAGILDINPDDPVLMRRRTAVGTDARPVAVTTSYQPAHLTRATPLTAPHPIDADHPPHWTRALYHATGHPVAVITTAITARNATDDEAASLHLGHTAPALIETATFYTDQQRPLDHSITVWPGDAAQLTAAYWPVVSRQTQAHNTRQ